MKRRQYVAILASALPLAGCIGSPGDPITMLAVNQDDVSHTVTVWAIQREKLAVTNTVEVTSEATARVGQIPWKSGQYRVTASGSLRTDVANTVCVSGIGRRRATKGMGEPYFDRSTTYGTSRIIGSSMSPTA